jgi:hypothetical protein
MERRSRIDETGAAYRGSQKQIQVYVNNHTEDLNNAIRDAVKDIPPKAEVHWASPLREKNFEEYWDAAFLQAVGLGRFADQLGEFWPRGGPHWDALARVGNGVLLVEAKAHPTEIFNDKGCDASARSREKIEKSLRQTCEWLRVPYTAKWMGRAYQSANRIAHLFFLREIAKVDAWLANIYFVDDLYKPTSREEWVEPLDSVKKDLGIAGIDIPHSGAVFLSAVG